MTTTLEHATPETLPPTPASISRALLALELRRLRLLLRRHILWLRRSWAHDPLQTYGRTAISDAEADSLLADGDEEAETEFFATDLAAARIDAQVREVIRAIAVGRSELEQAKGLHPIDRLARVFRLTRFERDIVLLCAAADLDPSFERLLAYAQDDADRRRPTPSLALALFTAPGVERARARDALAPTGTLRRQQIITVVDNHHASTALATRSLCIDERIVDYVRGMNRLDARVVDLLRPLAPPLLTPSIADLAARGARWVSMAARDGWPCVNIVGDGAWGRRELAHALCRHLSLRPSRLDAEALARIAPTDRAELIGVLERESVLLQLAYYIEGEETERSTLELGSSMPGIAALVETIAAPIVVGSREPLRSERPYLRLNLRPVTSEEQRLLWCAALQDVTPPIEAIDAVIQQFDLGPTMIAEAVAAARGQAMLDASRAGDASALWAACRELTGSRLHELAQRLDPRYDWDDLVLPAPVVEHLRDLAAQVAHRPYVYDALGFGQKLGRGRGISALFAGPSGTGKTMAAEVIANALALDLYRIDLSVVIDKYVGETEKRLRRVFDAAERSGAILFFDEADALFGKRSDVKDSHDRYANIEIDYILQRMEDYRGLAILATNRKASLDRAFLRRLRFLIDFPFPDVDQRRRIWRAVFPKAVSVAALDFEFLARLDLSGGNIRNIALNAAFLAAHQGTTLAMRHVVTAASREMAKMDRIVGSAEFGRYQGLLS